MDTSRMPGPNTGQPPSFLVATDLDGTLLDHHNYRWDAARPALAELARRRVPLVINTSKTVAEVRRLQEALAIADPFIVENGSAVVFHDSEQRFDLTGCPPSGPYRSHCLGAARHRIVAALAAIKARGNWDFEGFSDFDEGRVAALTGLDRQGARRALCRDYSEPLVWYDRRPPEGEFRRALAEAGLRLLRGGRFYHVLGDTDKGRALQWLARRYRGADNGIAVIALGDSDNDLDMLAVADYPVLVRSPAHPFPELRHTRLIRTEKPGPAGWNEAVLTVLGTNPEPDAGDRPPPARQRPPEQ